jgi:hypothetical protein
MVTEREGRPLTVIHDTVTVAAETSIPTKSSYERSAASMDIAVLHRSRHTDEVAQPALVL